MTIVIFVGPTLAPEEIAANGSFVCLPPATQGDLYRAARLRPRAIGVIDGYFSGAPSVWHKEILWAISQHIPVFGSASMGALRAAELHTFGMRGVGRIFEAFRDGALEDDDEVAVVHGPAELNYIGASEAMVNIRSTLACAEAEGVLSAESRRALERFGKSLYFPRRSWEALLAGAAALGLTETDRTALIEWLPRGRVDQKRKDALEMLAAMVQATERPARSASDGNFSFEWTCFWDQFVERADVGDVSLTREQQCLLDELRLEGLDAYQRVEARALLRALAARSAARPARALPRGDLQSTLTRLRARLGLFARADLEQWMARNDLDEISLESLVANEKSIADLRDRFGAALGRHILDELRVSGEYTRLAECARMKADELDKSNVASTATPTGSRSTGLRLWFFEQRLGRPMPEDVDSFARRLGFARAADFDTALDREWKYVEARRVGQNV